MSLLKCFKRDKKKGWEMKNPIEIGDDEDERRQAEEARDTHGDNEEEQVRTNDGVIMVYFACNTPKQDVINTLHSLQKDIQTFTVETECIEYITPITNKVFLIIDGPPPTTLIEAIEILKQIDSVFVYSPAADSVAVISQKQHTYLVNWCENQAVLMDTIRKSREELDQQTAAFSIYNKKAKAIRDVSKDTVSFVFFQLFKMVLKTLPKTAEAKRTMVAICRAYYRGNLTELSNIDEFDRTYKSYDAIRWYMKESFVYKFINKALLTEDIDVLYQFRFYIMDLSEQLQLKCLELRRKQKGILKLYQVFILSDNEVASIQNGIGNLISPNGYLSTSSDYSVAYGFATKSPKREGFVKALFEYQVDLNVVQNIVVADVQEYSVFPEEAGFVVDIGASFQIDSCQYNANEDLWHIQVHATDQGADLAAEYIEYQKKKMTKSNMNLMFGSLLLEMGEYAKAERYFDTILSSSNPTDEEIACIYFNFGRTHRLKGEFNRAISCYNRAYRLHMNARPKRSASAGKALNGLGAVYSEQGKLLKAEECFQQAMKLYKKSIRGKHVDIAGTLINLGTIDCDRQDHDGARAKYLQAKKIYDRSLPPGHPSHALLKANLGNVYVSVGQYDMALQEYESALKLQEAALPGDHPDIARTMHNLGVVHVQRGNLVQAREYLERAEEIAGKTLSAKHPLMTLPGKIIDFYGRNKLKIIFILDIKRII